MCWCTPQNFFDNLNEEFHFALDTAATSATAKCSAYFTPETDGLAQSWDCGGAVFCNPPYGREIGKWVKKAYEEAEKCKYPIVMLLPARTDTTYFHDYIYGKAEIRFIRGRLKFGDENGTASNSAPFPSMAVIFNINGEKMKIVPIVLKAANEYVAAAFCAKRIMRSHVTASPFEVVNSACRSRTTAASAAVG